MDVPEGEGLGAVCGRIGVFGRAEEEEEHNDDEVHDNFIVHSVGGVVGVEVVGEDLLDKGGVGRVGALFRVVLVSQLLEESSEYGYELVGVRLEVGIRLTQVGDARAHGCW